MSKWIGGLAEWREGDITYLSIAFTWKLEEAYQRAIFARAQGMRVIAGGPALYLKTMKHRLEDVAEIGKEYPDAVIHHNPMATIASRGCPVGCWFCIVPKMEGKEFTLLPDFPVRPILCDNNLSALPAKYQDYIIERYNAEDVKLIDANSGFEPITFTEEVYLRWKPLIRAGGGPWRFAFDTTEEAPQVRRVMAMLKDEQPKHKRPYVLIGNEPFDACMARIQETLDAGCEPHVQWVVKLTALEKQPWVRYDWTARKLRDVARWANRRSWRYTPFSGYIPNLKSPAEEYDAQQGLFV